MTVEFKEKLAYKINYDTYLLNGNKYLPKGTIFQIIKKNEFDGSCIIRFELKEMYICRLEFAEVNHLQLVSLELKEQPYFNLIVTI